MQNYMLMDKLAQIIFNYFRYFNKRNKKIFINNKIYLKK